MVFLPESYVIQQFYLYAGYPKYVRSQHLYNGCCPICREGHSWGKKKRLYYFPNKNIIYCHNCGWSSTPLKWIQEVSGKSQEQIIAESKDLKYSEEYIIKDSVKLDEQVESIKNTNELPKDCINLLDKTQVKYHIHKPIVQIAVKYIIQRRLNKAINKPRALYLSTTDFIHKNRLIIPFYEGNSVIFYQSRGLIQDNRPKYLSKIKSEKSLYGISNINPNNSNIFILEGPIDAFFIENGIATAGITKGNQLYTSLQQQQINAYNMYNKIWCLDSQWLDDTSREKSKKLLEMGEKVFIWPESIGRKYKDFNEWCIAEQKNSVEQDIILNNTFENQIIGLMKLKDINDQVSKLN